MSLCEAADDMMLYSLTESTKIAIRRLSANEVVALWVLIHRPLSYRYRLDDPLNPYTLLNHVPHIATDGVDVSPTHPDNFCLSLIQLVWRRLQ